MRRSKTGLTDGAGRVQTKRQKRSGLQKCLLMLVRCCVRTYCRQIFLTVHHLQMPTSILHKKLVKSEKRELRRTNVNSSKILPGRKARAQRRRCRTSTENEKLRGPLPPRGRAPPVWVNSTVSWRERRSSKESSARYVPLFKVYDFSRSNQLPPV